MIETKNNLRDSSWNEFEWRDMKNKLEGLSVDNLILIAKEIGVKFSDWKFEDKPNLSAKEQIILTFDETSKNDLMNAYKKLTSK